MATSRQPEPLSELYFTNYSSLPKTINVGKLYQGAFTMVNREGHLATYSYQEVLIENNKIRTFSPVTFVLGDGSSTIRPFYFSALKAGDTVEVVITTSTQQTIHYKVQA